MKIVILPGLSSPNCEKYRSAYKLLVDEARLRVPGSEAEVLLFPGQSDTAGQIAGEFLIPEASAFAQTYLRQYNDQDLVIIARSSGCNVVAHLMANWRNSPVRKAVLWGPPPFWLYYDMFVRDTQGNYAKAMETGVRITPKIAQSATPFESLLKETDNELLICAGTEDKLCPPEYINYLRRIFRDKPNIRFAQVQGAEHTVPPGSVFEKEYLKTIFGWIADGKGATA